MLGSSNWVAVNKTLTKLFGGDITISAIYSRFLSLQDLFKGNEFFQTYEQLAEYLGINRYQASKATLYLVNNGFIPCEKKGFQQRYIIFLQMIIS